MKKNLGTPGRILRFLIAIALLIWAYFAKSWLLLAASLFTFFEALMSWCIVYQLLGINHCPIKKK